MSTLVLHFTDEQIRQLRARAARLQNTLGEYVFDLSRQQSISPETWRDRLQALADNLPRPIPPLSDTMFDREELYRDS